MPADPLWVFCSGLKRSGSTLQYQIAKAVVERTGRGVGLGFCEPEQWPRLLRDHGRADGIRVVKCHRYLPGAGSLLRAGRARSIFIRRDLRDVCVSWMNKAGRSFGEVMASGFLDELIEDDFQWASLPATLESSYEEVLADPVREVERIATFLGIRLAEGEARAIAGEFSLERQKQRIEAFDFEKDAVRQGKLSVYDPSTLLHPDHVRSGAPRQWEEELTGAQVARLESRVGRWLARHGYELASSVAPPPTLSPMRRLGLRLRRWIADLRVRLFPGLTGLLSPLVGRLRRAAGASIRGLASVRATWLIGRPVHFVRSVKGPGPDVSLGEARRIVVLRLDRIGDVVLTLPLLRELRRSAPQAKLTLVVRQEARALAEASPHVDRVLAFDPRADGPVGDLGRQIRAVRLAVRRFWPRPPDIAIVPRYDADDYHATVLAYLSGAARRVAYSEGVSEKKARRNAGYDRLLTHPLAAGGIAHEVERNLDVVRALGGTVADDGLELAVGADDREYVEALLGPWERAGSGPLVALGVGAGEAKRRWPIERFIGLGRRLVSELDATLMVLGGPGEESLGSAIAESLGARAVDLVGRTTLTRAGALLERADLFIGNDTGVMHLAAAAGTPVVVLSCHPGTGAPDHRNSPARFGPWGVAGRVVRPEAPLPPCERWCRGREPHCITQLDEGAVFEAAVVLHAGTGLPEGGTPLAARSGIER